MIARRAFALAALVVVGTLSGCAAYPFVGPACGPGEVDIGSLSGNVTAIEIKGEVTAINETVLVLDDGTGDAAIPLFDRGVSTEVETGDCVIARGAATESPDRPQDVVVIYTELLEEEIVLEDERA